MTTLAATLYLWLAGAGIAVGIAGVAGELALKQRTSGRRALRVAAWAYGVAVIVAWILRYRVAGHLPVFGTYESALSLAATLMPTAMAWEKWKPGRFAVTPMAVLLSGALLAHGVTYDPTPYALTISERSWVVDVHAWLAWAAFAMLAINAILAALLLRPSAATLASYVPGDLFGEGRSEPDEKIPEDAARAGDDTGIAVDDATQRRLVFSLELGFLLHTAMLASGSFYKFLLFGTAWSFDPIETLGFIAWMAYGTLLHMHLFAGWRGRRLAAWSLGLFVLLVVSYRGIVYFPAWSTYHIFDMDLRMHLTGDENVPPIMQ